MTAFLVCLLLAAFVAVTLALAAVIAGGMADDAEERR